MVAILLVSAGILLIWILFLLRIEFMETDKLLNELYSEITNLKDQIHDIIRG